MRTDTNTSSTRLQKISAGLNQDHSLSAAAVAVDEKLMDLNTLESDGKPAGAIAGAWMPAGGWRNDAFSFWKVPAAWRPGAPRRSSPVEIDRLRACVAARVVVVNHAAPEVGADRKPQDKKPQQD